jgi:hypothetical protein
MTQLNLDLQAGQRAKRDGLDRVEATAQEWLADARREARHICYRVGTVTTDDVLAKVGLPVGIHHNVIGAIFRTGFERVGFRPTKRPEGHARLIGVWRMR